MKKDTTRVLVEATVRRTLKNIQDSPARATRNLVDMGLQFSNGRFQTRLFRQLQKMLQNEKSAYYDLAKMIASNVDHDLITTFGVNIGYTSCTKGAGRIRQIELENGFNIPWALNVTINEEKLAMKPEFYPILLQQATALGIHTFFLLVNDNPEKILPLISAEANCAFILFLHGKQVSNAFIEKMKSIKNAMISVCLDLDTEAACKKLRNARLLYAVHYRYLEKDKTRIESGECLQSILSFQPAFALLQADSSCPQQVQQEIYQYVTNVRDSQRAPIICMDIKQDTLMIDRIISDGECFVGFDENGHLRTHDAIYYDSQYNIFKHPLVDILQLYSKK